jgi:hypothetical protein
MAKKVDISAEMPEEAALESFARRLYPTLLNYFESDEGQRDFAEWKTKKEAQKTESKSDK